MKNRIHKTSLVLLVFFLILPVKTNAQNITIGSGTTFSLGSSTLSLTGNWSNDGTFNAGSGTIIFNGSSGNQTITNSSGETFTNIEVDKSSGDVRLMNDITVNGTLALNNGDFDLNGNVVTLGSSAGLNETAGNTAKGGTLTITQSMDAPSASEPAGLGLVVTSSSDLGSTTITRGHSAFTANSTTSIERYYNIEPAHNSGLDATLVFHYNDSELNGNEEASLVLFRSTDGGVTWSLAGGTVDTDNNTITLSSVDAFSYWTASGSGAFSTAISVSITGDEGWRMMSSPVSGAGYGTILDSLWTQGFTGADYTGGTSNVYTWDEVNQQFTSISGASDVPDAGTGFIAFVYDDQDYDGTPDGFPKTIELDGLQNTGTVSPALSYTDAGSPENIGWNLVGNPYGATIDWNAGSGWTKTNLDASVYIWSDSASGGAGAYLSWNGATGTLGDGIIAPWQGFWVKANTADPVITFTEDIRSAGSTFLKSSRQSHDEGKKAPVPQLRFTISDGQMTNSAIMMLAEEASTGIDPLDAWKLASLNQESLNLFTSTSEGKALDINALPADLDEPVSIDLDYQWTTSKGGSAFALALEWDITAFPDSWQLRLTDNHTGQSIDLKKTSTLEFETGSKQKTAAPTQSIGASVEAGQECLPSEGDSNHAERDCRRRTIGTPFHGVILPKVLKAKTNGPARFTLTITPGKAVPNEPGSGLPQTVVLDQNYPNPFNPSTVISYQLPVNSMVRVEVFDMLGHLVATLVDGERKSAGTHDVTFDAGSLASGVYLYRLKAGNNVFTKKLTLIK